MYVEERNLSHNGDPSRGVSSVGVCVTNACQVPCTNDDIHCAVVYYTVGPVVVQVHERLRCQLRYSHMETVTSSMGAQKFYLAENSWTVLPILCYPSCIVPVGGTVFWRTDCKTILSIQAA